jgi:nitrogen fixation/metabolism regulation signal transduction histidine kinase
MHPLVLVAVPGAAMLAVHVTSPKRHGALREFAATVLSAALLVMLLAVWLARFAGAFGGPVSL